MSKLTDCTKQFVFSAAIWRVSLIVVCGVIVLAFTMWLQGSHVAECTGMLSGRNEQYTGSLVFLDVANRSMFGVPLVARVGYGVILIIYITSRILWL